MPKIYEYLGIIVFIYTNDHLPIHVHAQKGSNESKIELIYEEGKLTLKVKKVRGKEHLSNNDLEDILVFINKYHQDIVEKWKDIMIFNKKVTFEKISKKVK
jgi:hypothetical protein